MSRCIRFRWLVASLLLIACVSAPGIATAATSSCPGLFEVRTTQGNGQSSCQVGETWFGFPQPMSIKCSDGTAPTAQPGALPCTTFASTDWPARGGSEPLNPPCYSAPPPPSVMQDCDPKPFPPPPSAACSKAGKGGGNGAGGLSDDCPRAPCTDASGDSCSDLGDPVDLTAGTLEQTETDLDLGYGLRFTRHYASALGRKAGMGFNGLYNLDWELKRPLPSISYPDDTALWVGRPLATAIVFFRLSGESQFRTSIRDAAAIQLNGDGSVVFTDEDGTKVSFNASDQLTQIEPVGEPTISVTHTASTSTFSVDERRLTLEFSAPDGNGIRKVVKVTGSVDDGSTSDDEVWQYEYDAEEDLHKVTGPNPSTLVLTDTIEWTFVYETGTHGPLKEVERTAGGTTTTIRSWTYDGGRVVSANEPALDQTITLSYDDLGNGTMLTTAKNPAGTTLATYTSTDGRLLSTTGLGGPGVDIPFATASLDTVPGTSVTMGRWRTKTDLLGRVTLYDDYDPHGRPQRIVEAWRDNPPGPGDGLFSSGDTYGRLREYQWHPSLGRPLQVWRPSTLTGLLDAKTIFDYDDPADTDPTPNQAPSTRVSHRIEQGKTLSAASAVVAYSHKTDFIYNTDGQVTSIAGPRPANRTEFSYDPQTGFRTAVRRYVNGSGSSFLETVFSDFERHGKPQTVTDPNGRVTLFTYDEAGRVSTATPPWTGAGSSTMSFTYDLDSNVIRVDFPPDSFAQAHFLRITYDAKFRVTSLVESNGDALVYEYVGGRRRRAALYRGFTDLDPGTLVGEATFEHDDAGRLDKAFNPLFADPNLKFTDLGHDAKGNLTSILDEKGRQSNLLYTDLDLLKQIDQVRQVPQTVTYTTQLAYDALSHVSGVTDPAGKATEYVNDDLGRLVKLTSPDTGVTLYRYDEAGNLVEKIESFAGAPRSTHYEYDGLDRLTRIDLPNDPDWVYTYDTNATKNQKGRLAQVTNGVVTTAFEYTDRGQVALERNTLDGLVFDTVTTYDAAGHVATLRGPGGTMTTTQYAGSRPKNVLVSFGAVGSNILNLEWLPFGPRTHAEFPPYDNQGGSPGNRVISERHYNLRGQADHIAVTGPGGLTFLDREYQYAFTDGAPGPVDPGPNLDQLEDNLDGSQSRFYFYDELDRLEHAKNLSGSALFSYVYDPAGNRTQQTVSSATTNYTYASGTDRLTQSTGATPLFYANDAFGNRIYAGTSAYSGQPTYLYNDENRLTGVQLPNVSAQYTYDAFGRRIKKAVTSAATAGTTYLFYDGNGQLLVEATPFPGVPDRVQRSVYVEGELLGQVYRDDQNAGTPAWTPGLFFEIPANLRPQPGVLAVALVLATVAFCIPSLRRRPLRTIGLTATTTLWLATACGSGPIFAWIHTDPLGTPLVATSTTNLPTPPAVIWRATYEPYGQATVNQDPDGDGVPMLQNVRFPGQYYDFESGLHYNFFRTYDPGTGRYLEADPIGQAGGANVFPYAFSSPTNFKDPSGQLALVDDIGLAILAGSSVAACIASGVCERAARSVGDAIVDATDALIAAGQTCWNAIDGDGKDNIPPEVQQQIDEDEAALQALKDSETPRPHPPNPNEPDVEEVQDISDSISRVWEDNPQRKTQQKLNEAMQREIDKRRGR